MKVPRIIGSQGTRLLYAPLDEWQSPRYASDVISFDMLPRDPWVDLAAGSSPSIRRDKDSSIVVSFAVALTDADQERWPGYGLSGRFSLAMVQCVDGEMSASTAEAEIMNIFFSYRDGLWVGRIRLQVFHSKDVESSSISVASELAVEQTN